MDLEYGNCYQYVELFEDYTDKVGPYTGQYYYIDPDV